MVKTRIGIAIALAIASTAGLCGTTIYNQLPAGPSPTPTATAATKATIEFRAAGNPSSVRLRYATPDDGVVQVVTALPYAAAFSTSADSEFLSFEATPIAFPLGTTVPFFTIQIVVDGTVFRQASAADMLLSTLQVSGTWRK